MVQCFFAIIETGYPVLNLKLPDDLRYQLLIIFIIFHQHDGALFRHRLTVCVLLRNYCATGFAAFSCASSRSFALASGSSCSCFNFCRYANWVYTAKWSDPFGGIRLIFTSPKSEEQKI